MTKLRILLRHHVPDDESGAISPGKLSLLLLAALVLVVSIPLLLSRRSESAPAPDPVPAAPSAVARLAPISQLDRWANKLDSLIATNERKALDLSERASAAAPNSGDSHEAAREWHTWSEGWWAALDSAGSSFANEIDSLADKNFALALRRLSQAFEELRQVPQAPPQTYPSKLVMDSHFKIAANHIKAARTYLDRVGQ